MYTIDTMGRYGRNGGRHGGGKGRSGRGGRGNNGRGGRGKPTASTATNKEVGMTPAIKDHTFILGVGHKNCADHNRSSYEALITYCGTKCGPNMMKELRTRQEVVIAEPEYSDKQKARFEKQEEARKNKVNRLIASKEKQRDGYKRLEAADDTPARDLLDRCDTC